MKKNFSRLQNTYKRHPVVFFLGVTFFISWSLVILYSLGQAGLMAFQLPRIALILFAQFGPLFSVLILAGLFHEKQRVKTLVKNIFNVKVKTHWFLLVIFLYPCIFFLSFLVNYFLGGDVPDFPNHGNSISMVGNFFIMLLLGLLFGGLSEEVGWRGFMLPGLQRFTTPILASLVIAIIWTVWHLEPDFVVVLLTSGWHAFFTKALPQFGLRFLETLPLTMIMTYIYNKTNGNLLLMILMHSASNATLSALHILYSKTPGLLRESYLVIIWGIAVGIMVITRLYAPHKKKVVMSPTREAG